MMLYLYVCTWVSGVFSATAPHHTPHPTQMHHLQLGLETQIQSTQDPKENSSCYRGFQYGWCSHLTHCKTLQTDTASCVYMQSKPATVTPRLFSWSALQHFLYLLVENMWGEMTITAQLTRMTRLFDNCLNGLFMSFPWQYLSILYMHTRGDESKLERITPKAAHKHSIQRN